MHTCPVEVVVDGGYRAEVFCYISLKKKTASERQSSCGGSLLLLAIYNAFDAPLLCKRGMMKRISSLRSGIPAAPPPPRGHECCSRCSTEHWRKILSTHSNLFELTYTSFTYYKRPCNRRLDREMLMGPNLHSNSISFLVFCESRNYRLCSHINWT